LPARAAGPASATQRLDAVARAAVQRTRERRERGGDAGVQVGAGGGRHARREGRGVQLVVGAQHQRAVERALGVASRPLSERDEDRSRDGLGTQGLLRALGPTRQRERGRESAHQKTRPAELRLARDPVTAESPSASAGATTAIDSSGRADLGNTRAARFKKTSRGRGPRDAP
jgi:hypothetical protein